MPLQYDVVAMLAKCALNFEYIASKADLDRDRFLFCLAVFYYIILYVFLHTFDVFNIDLNVENNN